VPDFVSAQQDSIPSDIHIISSLTQEKDTINVLAPAKAAFYSAVLPGLGQIYNRQYWKLILVYGSIGTGIYFYNMNATEYNRYRTAYFNRLNGLPDEFPMYTSDVLIQAQKIYRRQRDTSLLLTILAYALNIVDANVSAHLKQWNVDDNLSFKSVQFSAGDRPAYGFRLTLKLF